MTARWSMRPSTYDRMMRGSNQRRYYGDSGYFNFGYWGAGAKSQREASEALVELLAAFFGWSCKTYLLVSARKPS